MNGIIWLWKHRHCWKQLKYLYEHRYTLKLILSGIMTKEADGILACLREFDRVPLIGPLPSRPCRVPAVRPWKVEPPEFGSVKIHCRGFADAIEKSGKIYPTGPIPRRKGRPVPKQRDS